VTAQPVPRHRPVVLDEAVIARHQRDVWRYLRFLGCEPFEADDLTQDTFLALLRRPPQDPRALPRWLRTTALNLFRNRGRRPRPGVVLDEVALEAGWLRNVGAGHSDGYLEALNECLRGLSDDQRSALRLLHGEGRSRAEIAVTLGLAIEGVKSLLRRARARLQACVRRRIGTENPS